MMISIPLAELANLLRGIPLFRNLPEAELLSIASECRVDKFDADEIIFYTGDPTERLWIVQRGQVKILRHGEGGREFVPEIIPPGESFGGATIFFTRQPATATALTAAEVISFPAELYAEVIMRHPTIALNFIRMLGSRLQSLLSMNTLVGERVDRRVAHILLKLAARAGRADPEGTLITIPLSRQDIADMSGTTLETTIRIMSRFRAEGLVKTRSGGYCVILDQEKMQAVARTETQET